MNCLLILLFLSISPSHLLQIREQNKPNPDRILEGLPDDSIQQVDPNMALFESGEREIEAEKNFKPLEDLNAADIRDFALLLKQKNSRVYGEVKGMNVDQFKEYLSADWDGLIANLKFKRGVPPRHLQIIGKIAGALGLDTNKKKAELGDKIRQMKYNLRSAKLLLDKNNREFFLSLINLKDALTNLDEYSTIKYRNLNDWVDSMSFGK